ncbi:MAG: hypothetical protein MJE77_08025 [Proteobacteria bacterium]|nr:hypothetical protein [Pseudomonadota bacterium]
MPSSQPTHEAPGQQLRGKRGLALIVELPGRPIRLGEPCSIAVTLRNHGDSAVVINRRMSVGYRDSLSRELFAEIVDASTGKAAPYPPVDYDRDFSEAEDYVALAPGDTISGGFDLFEWYPLEHAGTYRLTVFYQATEELATPPAGTYAGTVSSRTVTVIIEDPLARR